MSDYIELSKRSFADLDALRLTAEAMADYELMDRVDAAIRARARSAGTRRTTALEMAMATTSAAMTALRGSSAQDLVLDAYGVLLRALVVAARDDEAEEIGRRRMNAELDARIAELDARADA